MVVVAQLVELRFVVPAVMGSSPIDHPKKIRKPEGFCRCIFDFKNHSAKLN